MAKSEAGRGTDTAEGAGRTIKTWSLTGVIGAGKYLGTVEADTEEEAIEKGWQLRSTSVHLCHECARECEDPEINEIVASELEGGPQ